MENTKNTRLTDKIIEALRTSALEMEKFQLTVALGKAEAKDSYEELKKKLNLFIHDAKSKIEFGKEKVDDINTKLDELRVQLSLGKTESIEAFNLQKKQILNTIHELEVKIKSNESLKKNYAVFLIEIEMFKVQLEILEKKLNEKLADTDISFKKSKKDFLKFIDRLHIKYGKKKETKWEHFQHEVSEAFDHLKQAFN